MTVVLFSKVLCSVQRWNALEEGRLKQEGELQTFLTQLLMEHRDRYTHYVLPNHTMNNQQTTSLPKKNILQTHPLHRTCFGQYHARKHPHVHNFHMSTFLHIKACQSENKLSFLKYTPFGHIPFPLFNSQFLA